MEERPGRRRKGAMPGVARGPRVGVATSSRRPRIVVAIRDLGFHRQVLDYLERDARMELLAAVTDGTDVGPLLSAGADVLVACPDIARDVRRSVPLGRLLIVAEQLTVPVLREAIDAGATGVFGWPGERTELADALATNPGAETGEQHLRGGVVAVQGCRGGAGVTFVATHLAARLAASGLQVALVDLDVSFGGLATALGMAPGEEGRSASDLAPVLDELSPSHVQDVLHPHQAGFSVLRAPDGVGPDPGAITPLLYRGAVPLLAARFDVVLLDLPRGLDEFARTALALAEAVLLVTTPDPFSLRVAKRLLEAEVVDSDVRRLVVLNRVGRGEIGPREAERVLGIRPVGALRFDPRVAKAQDRGELIPVRGGGIGRDLSRLTEVVVELVRSEAGRGEAVEASR